VDREPIEDEFFKGEEEEDGPSGRTDSLVREAIQNSMDAREGAAPSEVRFAFSLVEEDVSRNIAGHFLSALLPHLQAADRRIREDNYRASQNAISGR